MKTRWDAGQFKLRGKKERLLSCRCCVITDLRHEYNIKEGNKEMSNPISEFDQDCLDIYGKTLTGKYKHFCLEFDGLPIDETCFEFKYCDCFEHSNEIQDLKDQHVDPL